MEYSHKTVVESVGDNAMIHGSPTEPSPENSEDLRVDISRPDALLNDRLGIAGHLLFKSAGIFS
jgi:hypothetical protein